MFALRPLLNLAGVVPQLTLKQYYATLSLTLLLHALSGINCRILHPKELQVRKKHTKKEKYILKTRVRGVFAYKITKKWWVGLGYKNVGSKKINLEVLKHVYKVSFSLSRTDHILCSVQTHTSSFKVTTRNFEVFLKQSHDSSDDSKFPVTANSTLSEKTDIFM